MKRATGQGEGGGGEEGSCGNGKAGGGGGVKRHKGEVEEREMSLLEASEKGLVDVVRELLQKGADPNKANNFGETPFHLASRNGHLEVVRDCRLVISNTSSTIFSADMQERVLCSIFHLGHDDISTSQDPARCSEISALLNRFLKEDKEAFRTSPEDKDLTLKAISDDNATTVQYLPAYNVALVYRTAINCSTEQTTVQLLHT